MERNQLQNLLQRKRRFSSSFVLKSISNRYYNKTDKENLNYNNTYIKKANNNFSDKESVRFKYNNSQNKFQKSIDVFNRKQLKKQFKKNMEEFDDNLNDEDLRVDLRNIENWIYEHFCQMIQSQNLNKMQNKNAKLQRRKGQFLQANNYIIKEDTTNFDNRALNNKQDDRKRLTITRENLYREINFNIIKNNIIEKLKKNKVDTNNKKHILRYTKIYFNNITRCFQVLKNFKNISMRLTEQINKNLMQETLDELEDIYSSENLIYKNPQELEREIINELKIVEQELDIQNKNQKSLYKKIKKKQQQIKTEKQNFKQIQLSVQQKQQQINQEQNRQIRFYMELNRAKLDLQKYELQYNQKISEKENEEKLLQQQLIQQQKKTNSYKIKKFWLSCKLKDCYLELLQDENKLLDFNKTIIEILTKIYELDETVDKDNFSSFYTDQDIQFVFQYSKKLYQLKQQYKQIQITQKGDKSLNIVLDYIINLNEKQKILQLKNQMKKFKTSKNSFKLIRCKNKILYSKKNNQERQSQLTIMNNEVSTMKKTFIRNVLKRITNNFKVKVMNKNQIVKFEKICKLIFNNVNINKIVQEIAKKNSIVMIPIQLIFLQKLFQYIRTFQNFILFFYYYNALIISRQNRKIKTII